MKAKLKNILSNKRILIVIYILFALAAGIQSLLNTSHLSLEAKATNSAYNNYTIFERSFYHLKDHKDLYILHPQEHADLYKYTPSFSVFFGLFAMFPDWLGLNLWNLLNALVLLFAVYYLPKLSLLQKGGILLAILIELMTSMQNEQSNGLIAGLLVLSFGLLERKSYFFAALCVVFSVYIKLFGIFGFIIFLFYPNKGKLILYSLISSLAIFCLPFIFVDMVEYIALLKSYGNMLSNDLSISYGYSVMGWLHSWFGIELNKKLVIFTGIIILLLPLTQILKYKLFTFRYLTLASVLLWIVIFNHKAESPTFIIAMTGVALWFIISEKNKLNITLFVAALILTSLSPTDIFPKSLRDEFIQPYTLKAFPCILIWGKIVYDMFVVGESGFSGLRDTEDQQM